jgi:pimeloyl-ACP methyl ester carboxylesterase
MGEPHVHDFGGRGPGVILAHSAGSTGAQWRHLAAKLTGHRRVWAPDLYGHGQTPPWPGDPDAPDRPFSLADEAALLGAVAERADGPVHLVGHSYGGSACLRYAQGAPHRVRSLTLIEPTLSYALRDGGEPEAWQDLAACSEDVVDHVERGELQAAARRFMEYLLGPGGWDGLPHARKQVMTRLMADAIARETRAQLSDALALHDYRSVTAATLLVHGTQTNWTLVRICKVLESWLPHAWLAPVEGAGHMAPLSHPDAVLGLLRAHLDDVDPVA